MTDKKNNKNRAAWEKTSSRMPSAVQRALTGAETAVAEPVEPQVARNYRQLIERLPNVYRETLEALSPPDPAAGDLACVPRLRWCVTEQPEGEFPRVRMFNDVEKLARRLSSLEGQEVSVWSFLGVPLRMSTRDEATQTRYLFMPGEETAVVIPRSEFESLRRVPAELVRDSTQWQDDGWLGDPSLAEPVADGYYQGTMNPAPAEAPDEDDDDATPAG
jgi:hypothetical protein